jgi:hypothetical protein
MQAFLHDGQPDRAPARVRVDIVPDDRMAPEAFQGRATLVAQAAEALGAGRFGGQEPVAQQVLARAVPPHRRGRQQPRPAEVALQNPVERGLQRGRNQPGHQGADQHVDDRMDVGGGRAAQRVEPGQPGIHQDPEQQDIDRGGQEPADQQRPVTADRPAEQARHRLRPRRYAHSRLSSGRRRSSDGPRTESSRSRPVKGGPGGAPKRGPGGALAGGGSCGGVRGSARGVSCSLLKRGPGGAASPVRVTSSGSSTKRGPGGAAEPGREVCGLGGHPSSPSRRSKKSANEAVPSRKPRYTRDAQVFSNSCSAIARSCHVGDHDTSSHSP